MTAAPSVQPAAPLSPFAEPTRRVPGAWIAVFATAWLGIWMAQLVPIQLLLPLQVQAQLKGNYWVDSVVAFGVISAIAGVCALVAYPLAGALSDRTTSRFGRRRPWILAGAVIFALGLLLLGLQHSLIGVGIFWCVALIGFCVLSAALTATISDQVPVGQRGLVSAWISAPQAVGLIVGLLLVTSLALSQLLGYALMALIVVVLVLPFLFVVKDAVLPAESRAPMTRRRGRRSVTSIAARSCSRSASSTRRSTSIRRRSTPSRSPTSCSTSASATATSATTIRRSSATAST